jgi:hypothetical protein
MKSPVVFQQKNIEANPQALQNLRAGTVIVVTSINPPTDCLRAFAAGAAEQGATLIVAGDHKSPKDFDLSGAQFLGLDEQTQRFPKLAKLLPRNSYTRKNIGYLEAIKSGAALIIDTDDDNAPLSEFWSHSDHSVLGCLIERDGWVNAYAYFSKQLIWPRGFPLNEVRSSQSRPEPGPISTYICPVQQGLADSNPDVDAIYRLLLPLPVKFDVAPDIILAKGAWCPFNSQNTKWWPEVFPLLYLPAHCSFRMTDIWRSFVVQRILWENGWHVSFHASTVYQQRNEHDLMRDFEEEVSGYLHNAKIRNVLMGLDIRRGIHLHGENLLRCYTALIAMGVIGAAELPLLDAWIQEVAALT